MPAPRGVSNWPSVAERQVRCTVQYATPTTDTMGGRGEPTWTTLGTVWDAKVTEIPLIVNETQADILFEVEGPHRSDMVTYFKSGIGLRIETPDDVLKVFKIGNPQKRNRTLVAYCANAEATP